MHGLCEATSHVSLYRLFRRVPLLSRVSSVIPSPRTVPSPTGSARFEAFVQLLITLFQRWVKSHFTRISLKELSTVFNLGHYHRNTCVVPSSPLPLTVFHVTGVHTITITYCECDPNGVPPRVQLLRARWFPATWQRPSTAFTFRLLNLLHKLQSICKVNLYDFHSAIIAIFDNAGLDKPLVSIRFIT